MRPVCLIPEQFVHFLGSDERTRFQLMAFTELPQAWAMAEQHDVALFISDSSMDEAALCGLASGLQLLCEDAVHIHVFSNGYGRDLVTLTNRASTIRLLAAREAEDQLSLLCNEALVLYLKKVKTKQEMASLREINEQYEFMLRQHLLS